MLVGAASSAVAARRQRRAGVRALYAGGNGGGIALLRTRVAAKAPARAPAGTRVLSARHADQYGRRR